MRARSTAFGQICCIRRSSRSRADGTPAGPLGGRAVDHSHGGVAWCAWALAQHEQHTRRRAARSDQHIEYRRWLASDAAARVRWCGRVGGDRSVQHRIQASAELDRSQPAGRPTADSVLLTDPEQLLCTRGHSGHGERAIDDEKAACAHDGCPRVEHKPEPTARTHARCARRRRSAARARKCAAPPTEQDQRGVRGSFNQSQCHPWQVAHCADISSYGHQNGSCQCVFAQVFRSREPLRERFLNGCAGRSGSDPRQRRRAHLCRSTQLFPSS